jgi:hypothetical protein
MQAVYTFMTTSQVVSGALNTLDKLSGLLGAFCHDVDHPGVTSNFLINVNSPLALFYNDESVLENYHCSVSFLLMRDEENNIFSKLSPPDLKYVRKVVVATIMATDMAHHFRHITNLKTRIQNLPMKPFAAGSFDDRLMLTMLCMKCADLIHLVRPFKYVLCVALLLRYDVALRIDAPSCSLGSAHSNVCVWWLQSGSRVGRAHPARVLLAR